MRVLVAVVAALSQIDDVGGLKIVRLLARRFSVIAAADRTLMGVGSLATGLATQRVPEDDIVVVTVHFTKDNGELSSITLDENSKIEVIQK